MTVQDAIAVEQARHVHAQIPTAVIGGFAVACISAAAFSGGAEAAPLVAWLAANLVVALFRLATWWGFRSKSFDAHSAPRWLRFAMLGAALSGAAWGAGALFMFAPAELSYHLLYVFAAMMMGVASMFSFGVHLPTFLCFFVVMALPVLLGLLAERSLLHAEIAAAIAIFVAVALRFVREFHRVFVHAQRLRFENAELSLAKSRFLAAASHDLRQPMHALNLYLGNLAGLELAPAARATLADAMQCARTMDGMFSALLDISRLDAGAVQSEPRAFAIGRLLDRIRLEFEPQVHAKGLALRVVGCSAAVRADPAFVERILRNLVSNAVRYTERGRVLVGCRRKKGTLRIAVVDTGVGIAPQEQRLVFEEFYQSGNPERDRSKGIGLGLAIVERLARLMRSPLRLESEPGRGSVFALELPLADASEIAPEPPPLPGAARRSFAGSLVAVIDDEELILNATRRLLEQWRCSVVTAISGRQAVEQLVEGPRAPDAIVCDYRLRGGENGLAAIDTLRSEFNIDIPALLITGDTGPEHLREMQASGVRVLHKPVHDQALRAALGELLGVQA